MLRSFTSAMARRLGFKVAPPVRASVSARAGSRFRPRLEQCEAREVPAVWLGTDSTDAGDPDNWAEGVVPQQGDIIQFNADSSADCVGLGGWYSVLSVSAGYTGTITLSGATTITEFGVASGTVVAPGALSIYVGSMFGGALTVGSDLSCWSLDVTGGSVAVQGAATFDQLTLSQYAGTVALASGGTVGLLGVQAGTLALGAPTLANVFALSGGAIAQAASADLTVNGARSEWSGTAFTWTGGTLNSSASLATVTLTGATGLIAPAGAGTVALGSNLAFKNGSDVTVKEGTIDPNKDGVEISTNTGASLNFSPDSLLPVLLGTLRELNGTMGSGTPWTVKAGASVTHRGKLSNNDGTLTLLAGATVTITGKGGDDIAYVQNGLQAATLLQGGSIFVTGADKFAVVNQGLLATVYAAGTADATIKSDKLKIQGGDIYIAYQEGNNRFGQLLVVGNVLWDGGTFHAKVYSDGATCDSLKTSNAMQSGGLFDVDSGTVDPIYIDSDYGTGSLPQAGDAWEVLQAGGGFVDNTAPSVSDANAWSMRIDNVDPPIFWKVVAK